MKPAAQIIQAEEALIIETPERVPLEFALASIGNRFMAVAVDHVIQVLAILAMVMFLAFITSAGASIGNSFAELFAQSSNWATAIILLVIFFLFSSYFVFFEWLWNGQTPGKRIFKLRVIREDGRPITFWESMTRNLIRLGDAMPVICYSVGLIAVFLSSKDQRMGDLFAGTVVIRERMGEIPAFDEVFSGNVSDPAFVRVQPQAKFVFTADAVNDLEMELVESFLRRRWDLSEKQRIWMAWRIALPIMYKVKPQYDLDSFSYEGFLEELLERFYSKKRFIN